MRKVSYQVSGWFLSDAGLPDIDRSARNAVVLGTKEAGAPLAALLANELRVARKDSSALVCIWSDSGFELPRKSFPTLTARRLATKLGVRDLPPTVPKGSLVWMSLSRDPYEAKMEIQRARLVVDVPVVIVLAGVRNAEFDRLLLESEQVLISLPSWANEELEELAVGGVAVARGLIVPCRPLSRGYLRMALSGYRIFGIGSVALHSVTARDSVNQFESVGRFDSVQGLS